ncbi:MAG TPA: ABC transporter permease [Melioribacteraceae bacterium]|nr:ABC transporter permease [Melioribacteraceae bacterium]
MTAFRNMILSFGEYWIIVSDLISGIRTIRENWDETMTEMYLLGTKAIPLVLLGGLFTGVILAIETGHQLKIFGATSLISRTVSLGMVRELGPVVTGLLLAARTGAKNSSEIGAMKLSDQIDALTAFGFNPVHKLILPRTAAAIIMFLPLTLIADITGILGGMLIANQTFQIETALFWDTAINALKVRDLFVGFAKPFFFAFFISTISCYFGLRTTGGTSGLGKNTINAVVYSSIVILVIDFIFTKIVWEVL